MTVPAEAGIFLIDVGIRSIVLAAGVCLALLALRRKSAAFRHLIIWLGFAAMMLLPFASLIVTRTDVSVLPLEWADVHPTPAPQFVLPVSRPMVGLSEKSAHVSMEDHGKSPGPVSAITHSAYLLSSSAIQPRSSVSSRQSMPAAQSRAIIVVVLWLAGALLLLVRFGRARLSLYLFARRAQPLNSPIVTAVFEDVCRLMRCPPKSVRLVCGDTATPLTWGWPFATIALPPAADEWQESRLRSALLHEMAHVRRGDWLWQQAAELICVIYWFNPLIWIMLHRLRSESETCCDNYVLAGGMLPSEYAGDLLAIARTMKAETVPAALGMTRSSEISRRIRAIVGNTDRRLPHPVASVLLACTVLFLLAPTAGITLQPLSMNAAARKLPFADDTPAHCRANVAYIQEVISRYGEGNPNASDAYLLLGQQQREAGLYAEAIASFDRCLQLPEPAWSTMTHSFALNEKFQALQFLGKYREALAMVDNNHNRSQRKGVLLYSPTEAAQWRVQLTQQSNRQDNDAALRSQLAKLGDDDRWERKLQNGQSIQLKGMLITRGGTVEAFSPDGHLMSRHVYLPEDGKPWMNWNVSGGTTSGFGDVNDIDIVVAVKHPKDQPVFFRHSVNPETPELPNWPASGGTDGVPISNGSILSDEELINPASGGLRILRASLPTQTRTIRLTCGIAAAPKDVIQIKDNASSLMEQALYDTVTFDGIVSPVPPRPGTLDHPQ